MPKNIFSILLIILLAACQNTGEEESINTDKLSTDSTETSFILRHASLGDTIESGKPYRMDTISSLPGATTDYMEKLNPYTMDEFEITSNEYPLKVIRKDYCNLDSTKELIPKDQEALEPPRIIEVEIQKNMVIHPQQQAVFPWTYKDAAQYDIQNLSTDQGLVSNNINSIYQDSRNFMWFGTEAGLVRFDGRFTKTYTTSNGLQDDNITAVKEDSKGNIWLGTTNKGLIKFDGNFFYNIPIDSVFPKVPVVNIEIDAEDNIWFTPMFGGVSYYNGENIVSYGVKQGIHVHRPITSINFDKDGAKWFSGYGNGLYKLDETGMKMVFNPHNYMADLFIDHTGKHWHAVWAGEISYFENDTVYHIQLDQQYFHEVMIQIEEDSRGRIWALSNSAGIFMIDGNRTFRFGVDQGVGSAYANRFFIDNTDKIWLATSGGGVTLFDPQSFDCFNGYSSDFNGYVHEMIEMRDGQKVYATNKGIYFRNGNTLKHIHNEPVDRKGKQLQNSTVYDLEFVGDTLWSNHMNGGFQMTTPEGYTCMGKGMGGGPTNPTAMELDKNGVLWVGTQSVGFYRIAEDSVKRYTNEHSLAFRGISEIFCDNSNLLWIGSSKNGIAVYDGVFVKYYNTNDGLTSNSITHISQDMAGRIWLATDQGLTYYENEQFHPLTSSMPFFNQHICGIEQDREGKYWVPSKNGLAILIPKEDVSEQWDLNDYQVELIDKKNGLINSSFLDNSIYFGSDDRIYLGNEGGLLSWPVTESFLPDKEPEIFLDEITINGSISLRNIDSKTEGIMANYNGIDPIKELPKNLNLSFDYNTIEFSFSSLFWHDPRRINFRYKLDGLDKNWSTAGTENKASYKNLAYGDYVFQLKGVKYDGTETDVLNYPFSIQRPWYHTWWARTIYAILIVLLVYFLIQIRTRQLKRRQEQLENEIEVATEEIRTQKNEIEIAHEEIKDSIEYAKRIQTAILPPTKLVKSYIPNSFVLYKPKDIVAGDFYWMEPKEDSILFAAADCTGHGVPGAMVSVICNGGLNRSVREFGLTNPGDILTKTRELVIAEFEKSEEEVKDGMDIALCSLAGNKLKYAGAHNPLWIIREGSDEIEEIKADKQPIGKFSEETPFNTHEVVLNNGDTFYIFSDGFADQFGGDKGKKFKAANFKKLLLSIQNESMEKQRELINNAFEEWRGNLEQLDDVCVIGVRIE